MKRIVWLYVLLSVTVLKAQDYQLALGDIAEAESKSAIQRINQTRNLNTGNYDLKYHRLELTLDPNVAFLTGNVTSYFLAKENMSDITFELTNNMIVSSVKQRGVDLTFVQNIDDELVINLPQIQNIGVLDSLTISYSGNPKNSNLGSFEQTYHNGDPIVWTLSEPYGAKGWWPCKQDLNDKIDEVDVYLTTPSFNPNNDSYVAVSNGLEQSQTVSGNTKTTYFKHQYPIPAYLIAIAVTNYEVYMHQVDNNGNPFEIINYVYPENLVTAQEATPITVDIINLFSNRFENYPFTNEKYGHAQFGRNGGMEHTTVSFMGNFSRNLIAHELAHQWFGNKITCGSWKDIWLNEGFATYLSGLVVEDFDGDAEFKTWKANRITHITNDAGGAVYLQDTDTTSVSRIFNSRLSYSKGAMVLHMLRKKLGDVDFYQGMKAYLANDDFSYNYAKTEDFITVMSTSSGEDLTEFFNDWIYNQGYPSITVSWDQISETQIAFKIDQTQSHSSVSFFEMKVPIRVLGSGGETADFVLDQFVNGQSFLENINFDAAEVIIDPNHDVVSKNNEVLSDLSPNLLEISFKLFPNPAANVVYIQKPRAVSIYHIQIFDMLGKLIDEQNSEAKINVSDLSPGLHFIRFETNYGMIHKSLLKE